MSKIVWVQRFSGVTPYIEAELEGLTVAIEKRPGYCDRGRYCVTTLSLLDNLDECDGFPRYFMDLERAEAEMEDWMRWRVECRRKIGG